MQTLVLGAALLACCLAAVGARDTNRIRSPAEGSRRQTIGSRGRPTETPLNSNRQSAACSGPHCEDQSEQRDRCSNRAQRRGTSDRQADKQADRQVDRPTADIDHGNRTEADVAICVRSADCAAGACCVRYLNGRRCQRAPQDGEMCLLRGRSKRRSNPERCDCAAGLACAPLERAGQPVSRTAKDQGVCRPRQRKTRHSGKRRTTSEC